MTWTDQEKTITAINHIDGSNTIEAVVDELTEFVQGFGFETITIAQLVSSTRAGEHQLSITNWPADFVKERRAKNVFAHDPIIRQAVRTKAPFTWDDVYQRSDRHGRNIIDEARPFTKSEGLLIPIHPFDSVPGCVSLGTDKMQVTEKQINWIDVVAMQAYAKITNLIGPSPFEITTKLTPREVDVVHYGAAGKTNWEISQILGLSEHTVRDYFKTAGKKLNTVNRTHTIAVAISNDLVLT